MRVRRYGDGVEIEVDDETGRRMIMRGEAKKIREGFLPGERTVPERKPIREEPKAAVAEEPAPRKKS